MKYIHGEPRPLTSCLNVVGNLSMLRESSWRLCLAKTLSVRAINSERPGARCQPGENEYLHDNHGEGLEVMPTIKRAPGLGQLDEPR
jgi:hypothetical protein